MAIEWCQVCGSSVWSGQSCGKCAHDGLVAARDAEIAWFKAEVARLREYERLHGVRSNEIGKLRVDLAAHKRALAAGPAALREGAPSLWSGEAAAREVERAQAEAMKEKP